MRSKSVKAPGPSSYFIKLSQKEVQQMFFSWVKFFHMFCRFECPFAAHSTDHKCRLCCEHLTQEQIYKDMIRQLYIIL